MQAILFNHHLPRYRNPRYHKGRPLDAFSLLAKEDPWQAPDRIHGHIYALNTPLLSIQNLFQHSRGPG
jgi:hypothetical protein